MLSRAFWRRFEGVARHCSTGTERGALRGELSRELRQLRAQCERLSLNSARERIIHYIESEGDRGALTLARTKKQWATELGLTHESLYRTLSDITNSGSIRIGGRKIHLTRDRAQRV
jgi:CRP-like cAMP-binding protein